MLPLRPVSWLFFTCIVYLLVVDINLFVYKFTSVDYIQAVWLFVTALPLFIPMRKIVDINTFWRM